MAKSRDIDLWLSAARAHGFSIRQSHEQIFLRSSLAEALEMSRTLRIQMMQLREERRHDMLKLTRTLTTMMESFSPRAFPGEAAPKSRTSLNRPLPN